MIIFPLPPFVLSNSECSLYCVFLRADTESTSEHLEALKKLCSDLEEQKSTLEDLRDQKYAILPRLCLLDKELVKQQVRLFSGGSSYSSKHEMV